MNLIWLGGSGEFLKVWIFTWNLFKDFSWSPGHHLHFFLESLSVSHYDFSNWLSLSVPTFPVTHLVLSSLAFADLIMRLLSSFRGGLQIFLLWASGSPSRVVPAATPSPHVYLLWTWKSSGEGPIFSPPAPPTRPTKNKIKIKTASRDPVKGRVTLYWRPLQEGIMFADTNM